MNNRTGLLRIGLFLSGFCLLAGCTGSTVLPPGSPLPKLEAAGWVNGDAPAESELAGKVMVIDVWAYW